MSALERQPLSEGMLARLKESITRYGLVTNLVVRKLEDDSYEVLSEPALKAACRDGPQGSALSLGSKAEDAHARLLSQALNHLQGEDDIGLRIELLREVLKAIPEDEVAAILPETVSSLSAITSTE